MYLDLRSIYWRWKIIGIYVLSAKQAARQGRSAYPGGKIYIALVKNSRKLSIGPLKIWLLIQI